LDNGLWRKFDSVALLFRGPMLGQRPPADGPRPTARLRTDRGAAPTGWPAVSSWQVDQGAPVRWPRSHPDPGLAGPVGYREMVGRPDL